MDTTDSHGDAPAVEKRALQGLFPQSALPAVVRQLREDLLARRLGYEVLLSQYVAIIEDEGRRTDAATDLRSFFDGDDSGAALQRLVEILYFSGHQRLLAKHRILFPAYNVLEEYLVNATGPWGPTILPRPSVADRSWSLFGEEIDFPIGIPSSFLTDNSRWVQYFAANGFNVLTFRTVRSRASSPNVQPNWAFAGTLRDPLSLDNPEESVRSDPTDWVDPGTRSVSTTNSFGVPSLDPDAWAADLQQALEVLSPRQVLLVSVMGDDYDQTGHWSALIEDYVRVAQMAERAGARHIELNLSCPNSLDDSPGGVKPPLCGNVKLTTEIVKAVREAVDPGTRLVAKLSYLNVDELSNLIPAIVGYIDGVAAINTLQVEVLRDDGEPTFPGRRRAGVSGIAIRNHAIDMVRRLAQLRIESGVYFEILGMGGVTDSESFLALYEAGASVVQVATGAFANPFLAAECVEALGNTLPTSPELATTGVEKGLRDFVLQLARDLDGFDKYSLATAVPVRPSQTFKLLDAMVRAGELIAVGDVGMTTRYRAKPH